MNRLEFLGGVVASATSLRYLSGPSTPQDDTFDPASEARTQALRVLLGSGDAQRIDGRTFLFNGRPYRGAFSIESGAVVNTLTLEEYLYSVVSREMPHSWPDSALQAQAVVARTYVLQRSNPNRAYDLVPSEANQVYTGIDAEHPETSAAVNATSGQVLRYGSAFAQVLYSSCCGGHTESNGDAWGGLPIAYLCGVQCGYCNASPWYKWTQHIPLDQLQNALASPLRGLGDISGITADSPDASGRAKYWMFNGSSASRMLKAEDVRRALGTRVLPSLLVHAITVQAGERADIEGGGLGHGVGLCQWGARGLALTGADARAILAYYYPGTGIGNV
jgi:stage II sporulation protein D